MGFWKGLGNVALSVGKEVFNEVLRHGNSNRRMKDASDDELKKAASQNGLFSDLPDGYQRFDKYDDAYKDYSDTDLEAEKKRIDQENDKLKKQQRADARVAKMHLEKRNRDREL